MRRSTFYWVDLDDAPVEPDEDEKPDPQIAALTRGQAPHEGAVENRARPSKDVTGKRRYPYANYNSPWAGFNLPAEEEEKEKSKGQSGEDRWETRHEESWWGRSAGDDQSGSSSWGRNYWKR